MKERRSGRVYAGSAVLSALRAPHRTALHRCVSCLGAAQGVRRALAELLAVGGGEPALVQEAPATCDTVVT